MRWQSASRLFSLKPAVLLKPSRTAFTGDGGQAPAKPSGSFANIRKATAPLRSIGGARPVPITSISASGNGRRRIPSACGRICRRRWCSDRIWPTEPKRDRALVLAFAIGELALAGGERVGLLGGNPPSTGRHTVQKIALSLAQTGKGRHRLPQPAAALAAEPVFGMHPVQRFSRTAGRTGRSFRAHCGSGRARASHSDPRSSGGNASL